MSDGWGDLPQDDWSEDPPLVEDFRGQARMAERLVREHGQELRYVALLGWFIWDGSRWVLDKDGEPTRRSWPPCG